MVTNKQNMKAIKYGELKVGDIFSTSNFPDGLMKVIFVQHVGEQPSYEEAIVVYECLNKLRNVTSRQTKVLWYPNRENKYARNVSKGRCHLVYGQIKQVDNLIEKKIRKLEEELDKLKKLKGESKW
jgi:hypothetical protein